MNSITHRSGSGVDVLCSVPAPLVPQPATPVTGQSVGVQRTAPRPAGRFGGA